jgi:hypothetical protein
LTWTGPIPGQFNAAFTESELGQSFNHLVRKKKRYIKRPKTGRKGTSTSGSDSSASSRLVSFATVTAASEAAAAAGAAAAAVTTSAPTDTTDTVANTATSLQRAAALAVVAAQAAAAQGAVATPVAPVPVISPTQAATGYWPLTAVQSVTAADMETVGQVLDTHGIRPSQFDSKLVAIAVNGDLKVWHSLDPRAHTGNRFYLFLTHIR